MAVLHAKKPIDAFWHHPQPRSIEDAAALLEAHIEFLAEDSERGVFLRKIYARVRGEADVIAKKARQENPIAFVKLGWEQALKCNSWIWGVTFLIDFDANRKGKTATTIFHALLFMLPNDPEWRMFQPYTDDWGREVRVYQRPSAENLGRIRNFLREHPEYRGDPMLQPYEGDNKRKFAILQKCLPGAFQPCWPLPSYTDAEHTGWHGGPDVDYHKQIVMPEWRKWLPKNVVTRDSEYDKVLELRVPYGEDGSNWTIIFKSYESKDTKWSGAATTFILLTEGITNDTLDEVKQRFRADAFACWDYTPYEARNTHTRSNLAYRVFEGKEELPLCPFVFSGMGIEKIPDFILPEEKRNDLLRVWKGKAQGKARIEGRFFTSSPVAIQNLDKPFHTVPWTKEELFQRFPDGRLFRGLDPGYDHPTACCWALLTRANTWFVYRFYSKSGTTIASRCQDIVGLSGNSLKKHQWGKGPDDYIMVEVHDKPESEVMVVTIADYHTFKTDEQTERPYAWNYTKEGLVLIPSVTHGPKFRLQELDRLLEKNLMLPHPILRKPPGSKIYYLINETGVAEALEKMENIFWDRYASGEHKGQPKDEIQDFDDDEFDSHTYIVCSPYRWTPNPPPRRLNCNIAKEQKHMMMSMSTKRAN